MDIVSNITSRDFVDKYIKPGKPVLIKQALKNWKACQLWGLDYFEKIGGNVPLYLKTGNVSDGKTVNTTLQEYSRSLRDYEKELKNNINAVSPGYLHDLPIFHVLPQLIKDIEFPVSLVPKWYRQNWWDFAQFFMGSTGSFTPLHFDTLLTHNLFFQIVGTKRFLLIPGSQSNLCYLYNWRWARVDASLPNYDEFPLFRDVNCEEVLVEASDILYMPSGMLHQVHGLDFSISFNLDWHSRKSALNGVASVFRGAPRKNLQYNVTSALALWLNLPKPLLFPFYKSYLNYIS